MLTSIIGLIAFMFLKAGMSVGDLGGYFTKIHMFVTPLNEYHEFYLFWWFACSIMIGQRVSRSVGGIKTWQLLAALLVSPSIPLALWFSALYFYVLNGVGTEGIPDWAMTIVGLYLGALACMFFVKGRPIMTDPDGQAAPLN